MSKVKKNKEVEGPKRIVFLYRSFFVMINVAKRGYGLAVLRVEKMQKHFRILKDVGILGAGSEDNEK